MDYCIQIFWLALMIFLLIVEACTVQLVVIWFGLGSLAALITSFFTANVYLQIGVFTLVSVISLFATRSFVKKALNFKREKTNSDKNIGKIAIVTMEIDNLQGVGQVEVDGEQWTARAVSNQIVSVGSNVMVEAIEGVKLIVAPV